MHESLFTLTRGDMIEIFLFCFCHGQVVKNIGFHPLSIMHGFDFDRAKSKKKTCFVENVDTKVHICLLVRKKTIIVSLIILNCLLCYSLVAKHLTCMSKLNRNQNLTILFQNGVLSQIHTCTHAPSELTIQSSNTLMSFMQSTAVFSSLYTQRKFELQYSN